MIYYGHKSGLDLTDKTFGQLKVLRKATSDEIKANNYENNRHIIWCCRCSCGNICFYPSSSLTSKRVISCSECLGIHSKGEFKIKKILEEANIPFVQEKTFSNCLFEQTNKRARFDFYVQDKYLIEYDGIQHFKDSSSKKWETLEERQRRDRYKNQWCKENNIPLIRIPYTQYDNLKLEDLLLETTTFLS